MRFSYQDFKRSGKNSIVLEKQENIEIQQNSLEFWRKKSTFIRERFYCIQPQRRSSRYYEQQPKERIRQTVSENRVDLIKVLVKNHCDKCGQKVDDTSHTLHNLEQNFKHEIAKFQEKSRDLLRISKKMEKKKNHKNKYQSKGKQEESWAQQLAGNSSGTGKQGHLKKGPSALYGEYKNEAHLTDKEECLDRGAVGDHNSNFKLKKEYLQTELNNIKPNDLALDCCYCVLEQPLCHCSVHSKAANGNVCHHHNYQQAGADAKREYHYCRDEYYYNCPNCNCKCNSKCASSSKAATPAITARRQQTDLNTQYFYQPPREKSRSPATHSEKKFKRKNTENKSKSKESHEEYNNRKRSERDNLKEKTNKRQMSKSKQANKISTTEAEIFKLLSEKDSSKIVKILDRYVEKLNFQEQDITTTNISDDSAIPTTTLNVRSATKSCQVTLRKKQQQVSKTQNASTESWDNVSLETLQMLKKIKIREYKPIKPKEKILESGPKLEHQEKVKNYQKYLEIYEKKNEIRRSIHVLKEPAASYGQHQSEQLDYFKEQGQRSTNTPKEEDYSAFFSKTSQKIFTRDERKFSYPQDIFEEIKYDYKESSRVMPDYNDSEQYDVEKIYRNYYQDSRKNAKVPKPSNDNNFKRKADIDHHKYSVKDQNKDTYGSLKDGEQKYYAAKVRSSLEQSQKLTQPFEENSYFEKSEKRYQDLYEDTRDRSAKDRNRSRIRESNDGRYQNLSKDTNDPKLADDSNFKLKANLEHQNYSPKDHNGYRFMGSKDTYEPVSPYYPEKARFFLEQGQQLSQPLEENSYYEKSDTRYQDFSEVTRDRSAKDRNESSIRGSKESYKALKGGVLGSRNLLDQGQSPTQTIKEIKYLEKSEDKYQNFKRADDTHFEVKNGIEHHKYSDNNASSVNESKNTYGSLEDQEQIPAYYVDKDSNSFEQRKQPFDSQREPKYYENKIRDSLNQFKYLTENLTENSSNKTQDQYEDKIYKTAKEKATKSPEYQQMQQFVEDSLRAAKKQEHGENYKATKSQYEYENDENDYKKNYQFIQSVDYQSQISRESAAKEPQPTKIWDKENEGSELKNIKENEKELVREPKQESLYSLETFSQEQRLSTVKSSTLEEDKEAELSKRSTYTCLSDIKQADIITPRKSDIKTTNKENLYQESPEDYDQKQFNEIENKSNASSHYNDFKQIMNHDMGLYSNRSSETEETQLNSQKAFDPENVTEQISQMSLTTGEALKYLKGFLRSYQHTQAKCLNSVTTATNDLIKKLSSCKTSSSPTEEAIPLTSQEDFKEPTTTSKDKSTHMLEEKITQGTQYKEPESTRDSNNYQFKQDQAKELNNLSLFQERNRRENQLEKEREYSLLTNNNKKELESPFVIKELENLKKELATSELIEIESNETANYAALSEETNQSEVKLEKEREYSISNDSKGQDLESPVVNKKVKDFKKDGALLESSVVLKDLEVKDFATENATKDVFEKQQQPFPLTESNKQQFQSRVSVNGLEPAFYDKEPTASESLVSTERKNQELEVAGEIKQSQEKDSIKDLATNEFIEKKEITPWFSSESNNQKKELASSVAIKDVDKELTTKEFYEKETYRFQSQATSQHWQSSETYQRYQEYKDNMPLADEFSKEQGSHYYDLTNEQQKYREPHYTRMNEQYICSDLPSSSRQTVFDPDLMPLRSILKSCRVVDNNQEIYCDLESCRTTSSVSVGQTNLMNTQEGSSMIYNQGQEIKGQQLNEDFETIITKDKSLRPIMRQSDQKLTETTTTNKQPIYEDCQVDVETVSDIDPTCSSSAWCPVEMPTFEQCPCMFDIYVEMMINYYNDKKK